MLSDTPYALTGKNAGERGDAFSAKLEERLALLSLALSSHTWVERQREAPNQEPAAKKK